MPHKASTQLGGIANLALMAPVRAGFIPGADTFTYAKRLEMFFKTLNAIRLASREASLSRNPFPDALGRWGILQAFRYALIPPEIGSRGEPERPDDRISPGVWRLYLNVTFDGGWEPYMRVIYRDLGSLLDAIFCNCDEYPRTTRNSFDAYCTWVRRQEIAAGIFYTDSSLSMRDQRYLEDVERTQRQATDPVAAREAICRFALPPTPTLPEARRQFAGVDPQTQQEAVINHLRALKGLYDLRTFYADNEEGDARCLWRFACDAMPEFGALLPELQANPALAPFLNLSAGPIGWLVKDRAASENPGNGAADARDRPREATGFGLRQIQCGIMSKYADVTHGCLFLIAITDATQARQALRGGLTDLAPTTDDNPPAPGEMYRNIAFTRQGLARLAPQCIEALPQEFIDGMPARAGLLGDLGHNHPDHWQCPTYRGRRIDLGSVHLVLQLRFRSDDRLDDATLHPKFEPIRQKLDAVGSGLRVLAIEPMRSYPERDGNITREHFGFQDGFSQPKVEPASFQHWDDQVARGELFLGHPNDRHGGTWPARDDPLLDHGSFLVIRKIRQNLGQWDRVLREGAAARDPGFATLAPAGQATAMQALAAKLMGRDVDGKSLVDPGLAAGSNDFDFAGDAEGSACPFQSHIRRANPRLQNGAPMPRIVRRGMSYGPRAPADAPDGRGLFFMAYCGSIAEQFEVIQRWIAGGNSSGVLAAHSDPILGVTQRGVPRSFQWWDADRRCVERIDLGDLPLTTLEWGLYLFVPSRSGLAALCAAPTATGDAPVERALEGEPYDPGSDAFHAWQRLLQDRATRDGTWRRVQQCPGRGRLQTAYGLLVSHPDEVMKFVQDGHDAGQPLHYSVCGYGRRFHASIGDGYLGMDPAGGHTELAVASGVNAAIIAITEEKAFCAAKRIAGGLLTTATISGRLIPVDVSELTERVLAALCTEWFGLPDGRHMQVGTLAGNADAAQTGFCPRDLIKVARFVFGAHPSQTEIRNGTQRGEALYASAYAFLTASPAPELVGLSAMIESALRAKGHDVIARTIVGVMLGFAPSVHGNFVNLMRALVDEPVDDTLWDLQLRLLDRLAVTPAPDDYTAGREVLRRPLLDLMRREPLPATIWREPVGATPHRDGEDPEKIVIGLHGLMQYDGIDDAMLFGGTQSGGPGPAALSAVHACPGYGMAVGALMGIVAALLLVGTLRPTPSPTILRVDRTAAPV